MRVEGNLCWTAGDKEPSSGDLMVTAEIYADGYGNPVTPQPAPHFIWRRRGAWGDGLNTQGQDSMTGFYTATNQSNPHPGPAPGPSISSLATAGHRGAEMLLMLCPR